MTDDTARLATLDRLFAAFNRHDADGVMACFAPEAVFYSAAGSEPTGSRIAGPDAIRAAFVAIWTDMPDVQCTVRRSRVLDGAGIAEWLYRNPGDGTRVEVEGLDLFDFAEALVAGKSAFRKQGGWLIPRHGPRPASAAAQPAL